MDEEKQRLMKALGELHAVRSALEVFRLDHEGKSPGNLEELVPMYMAKLPHPKVPGGTGFMYFYGKVSLNSSTIYKCKPLDEY